LDFARIKKTSQRALLPPLTCISIHPMVCKAKLVPEKTHKSNSSNVALLSSESGRNLRVLECV
jgi:hypothetical protein